MRRSTIFVFLSAVFFALGGLFFKICPWDAMAISSARSILAAGCIYTFLRLRHHRFRVNGTVIAAALSISVTNMLYALANKLTTAGNAIVLQFSMPAFVILIMLVLYRKKPSRLEVGTCAAVLLGIICFFIDSFSAGDMLGNSIALLSGIAYAFFFVCNSRENSEPFTAIMLSYLITALVGLPSLLQTEITATPLPGLLAVLGLGIIQQGAGHICFALGIKETSPVTASLISGIEPILNPVLVAIFWHEVLTPMSLVGAAIVLCSVILYNVTVSRSTAGV